MSSRRRNAIEIASATVCLLCASITTRAAFLRPDTTQVGCPFQKPFDSRRSEAEYNTTENGARELACSMPSLLQLLDYMQRYLPRPVLQPSPNTVIATIVLFALGMVAMYDLDEEEKEVRSKALEAATIGACILGASLGGGAKQIILVCVPWSMLFATALHRLSSRGRKKARNDMGTQFEKDSKR